MFLLFGAHFGQFLHSKFQSALELMHFYTGEHFSLGVFIMPKVGQQVDLDNVHQVVTCFDMSS